MGFDFTGSNPARKHETSFDVSFVFFVLFFATGVLVALGCLLALEGPVFFLATGLRLDGPEAMISEISGW